MVEMPNDKRLFDTSDALTLIILWIVFGYLTVMLNCDIQRLLMNHPVFLHAMALVVFFFLFTTLDPKNQADAASIAIKTFFVYIVFLLITKSKWYFALPVIVLLLIDQGIKRWEDSTNVSVSDRITKNKTYVYSSKFVIMTLVILGTIDYARIQKNEYKSQFSWFKFFFGLSNRCKRQFTR